MIRFAICDDEPHMAREIAEYLSEYMRERGRAGYCIESFSDARSLLERGGDFDVVFLDIQMDDLDGMEAARILRQRQSHSLLIFVTVLRDRVFDAFAVEAHDYLLKPLDRRRFQRTLDRAMGTLERRAESLVVRRGGSCQVVPLADIVYCEVRGRKIYIHQRDGTVVDYYDKLSDLERRVDGRFFRCHRSYLVHLECVRGCGGGRVRLSTGDEIPVSRLRERELTQALLRRMKERER